MNNEISIDTYNQSPEVSVILPAHNAENYITDAINSILKQTFINFELIIINDGSTDGTQIIIDKFKNSDKRIRAYSRENRGLVATLNEGIDLATGKWIARMDADDIALPSRLEKQLIWIEKTQADICGSWIKLFGSGKKRTATYPITDQGIKTNFLFGTSFAHPTVMIRTDVIKMLRYRHTWEKCEDYDLWVRAAKYGWKMANIPEVLLYYRIHKNQITLKHSTTNRLLVSKIRLRYFLHISNTLELSKYTKINTIKACSPQPINIDLDDLDLLINHLLLICDREARNIVLINIKHIYYNLAHHHQNITSRYRKLNKSIKHKTSLKVILKLWILNKINNIIH